ncbi:bifunctional proline dehydrogenase/L-glutamate gamma-semialdehyde dehydrogenase PutA [Neptunomonas marina]|uniref:Bifunctional protein PutA n=1 Tax=Neptunomonas marina TaxID=1815562 RepID=A0A437QA58_9GAMM|nr:bifunctional proline dehydrogenase/L-glutamate gamma-semialdehyde dehydrogenase PutA [Neptunomonas marina]RVU31454.1 bifunctional proline dehydrogenase/L-glutamate gamma-semialdehyde dehydrogenase PutA [Neptunomonas marina]
MFKATDVLIPGYIDQPRDTLWEKISPLYAVDESAWLKELLPLAAPSDDERNTITQGATALIEQVRADDDAIHMVDALLLEYSLDTQEGILLMCLAEALMRIPDADTADALIRDKLSVADWKAHLSKSDSLFVNASTWGLLLTGKVVSMDKDTEGNASSAINRLVNKMSEPVIRKAMYQAMKIMGHQFVLGRSIDEALKRGKSYREKGYTYSFDMLGEAALTQADAKKYFDDYLNAIEAVGNNTFTGDAPRPTISIKLSALHPRYEVAQKTRVMEEMYTQVIALAEKARALNVGITIDAEEADRLELSLELFEKLYTSTAIKGWGQFGLVVQAYSKRALPVLAWLAALAKAQGDCIPLRLVKGAYWDSEIKNCQQRGLQGYPVYTRKEATDTAYLACARFLLSEDVRGNIYPQFASHNAHTVAAIVAMAAHDDYEFQRLHGMGDALYNTVIKQHDVNVRIYAPVGNHKDLLPYLVRRLLENGANSSFVHRLVDARCPVADLVHHPVDVLSARKSLANPYIPLPGQLYGDTRANSQGVNIDIEADWEAFAAIIKPFMGTQWQAGPIVNGQLCQTGEQHSVTAPYQHSETVGQVYWADADTVQTAIAAAADFYPTWRATPVAERAAAIAKLGDLLEANYGELMALCHREAGKTLQDSIDEIREAVDFCRYYAVQAQEHLTTPHTSQDFNGTSFVTERQGRGVFACISPWNFPLAIFLGQVTAALAAGNTVIAKPAEQTSLIAYRAIELLLEAGVPAGAIQLLPGDGATVGAPLTSDVRIAGVAFTGSTETARLINRSLANRNTAPAPLIAETGGQNAMIIDSTSLPEQVVRDVVRSAFASAGQRCSALRVLFVQEDIAERVIPMIRGAMLEQVVGDPSLHQTDVGPVIDREAQAGLLAHIERMQQEATLIAQTPLPHNAEQGTFVAPTAFEINSIDQLGREQFGPILHVVRYKASELDQIIDRINATGYGLTLGIHSRNETTSVHITQRVRAGNMYVNRDQVGAVVGVQPFGGQGLSGTGPKAGGPHYLKRFTKTVRVTQA